MGNDGHEELAAQPATTLITYLDKLLPTWDGSSPLTPELLQVNGIPEDDHLEMKETEPKDIDVILLQSEVESSFFGDEEDGQVLNGVAVEKTEVGNDKGSSTIHHPADAELVESTHVWYASYGSNMYKPRFMCYIEGGQIEGMTRPCLGCRDTSAPVASEWLCIPNRLFFGHKGTKMWGAGGVAFLDPHPEPHILTHVRIYKITMEQFNDVISQENPGKVEKNWMIGKHIHQLKNKPHHLMEIFEGAWYGTVLLLGEKDGLPILTFTCPESHMEKFRTGEFGTCAPSVSYRSVIVHGLVEDLGLGEEQALAYVASAVLPNNGVGS